MSARFICIGTHNKTGTIWMRKVFRLIANEQNIPFMQCYRAKRLVDLAPSGPHIVVNWSSSFPKQLIDNPAARFFCTSSATRATCCCLACAITALPRSGTRSSCAKNAPNGATRTIRTT